MQKKLKLTALLVSTILILFINNTSYVVAKSTQCIFKQYMTYYLPTGRPCYNGDMPEPGVAAYTPDTVNNTIALLWAATAEDAPIYFIGAYVITDTGGERVRNGDAIDIYMPTEASGKQFLQQYGTYAYMVLLPVEDIDYERSRFSEEQCAADNSTGCVRIGAVPKREIYRDTTRWVRCIRQLCIARRKSLSRYSYPHCTEMRY